MDFKSSVQSAIGIIQLKEPVMQSVAADPRAIQSAWIFVVLGALATSLGVTFFPVEAGEVVYRPDLFWILKQTFFESLGMLLGLYLGGFAAEKWFGSKLPMLGFVRVMGYAALLGLVTLIPALAFLCLWNLVVWWKLCTGPARMSKGSTAVFLVLLVIVTGSLSYFGGAWLAY